MISPEQINQEIFSDVTATHPEWTSFITQVKKEFNLLGKTTASLTYIDLLALYLALPDVASIADKYYLSIVAREKINNLLRQSIADEIFSRKKMPALVHFFWDNENGLSGNESENIVNFFCNQINTTVFWAKQFSSKSEKLKKINYFLDSPSSPFEIMLWVNKKSHVVKNSLLAALMQNARVKIMMIESLNDVIDEMSRDPQLIDLKLTLNSAQLKKFIWLNQIGLGERVTNKDALGPVILYQYGGYFFDLDACAMPYLTLHQSLYGLRLVERGNLISAFATTPKHPLCLFATHHLLKNLNNFALFDSQKEKKLYSLQALRNKKNPERVDLVGKISAYTLREAYKDVWEWLKNAIQLSSLKLNFCDAYAESNFLSQTELSPKELGVKLDLEFEGKWRDKNLPSRSFEM